MDQKHRCHAAVKHAIKIGLLQKQSCERCEVPFIGPAHHAKHKVMAHHDDYTKPLDVTWLCYQHHIERHEELGWGLKPRIFNRDKLRGLLIGDTVSLQSDTPTILRAMAHQAAKRLGIKLSTVIARHRLTIYRIA